MSASAVLRVAYDRKIDLTYMVFVIFHSGFAFSFRPENSCTHWKHLLVFCEGHVVVIGN